MRIPSYDDAAHTYHLDGIRLRSVSQIIRAGGADTKTEWYTDDGRVRGKAVHAVCVAVDCWGLWRGPGRPMPWPRYLPPPPDVLVEPEATSGDGGPVLVTCPESLAGYVDGYWKWRELFGPRWSAIEVPLGRLDPPVGGTPDRVGCVRGRPAVVEIKTSGSQEAWHGLQTAAYDWLDPLPIPRDRFAVYLKADGTFRMKRYDSPSDLVEFLMLADLHM